MTRELWQSIVRTPTLRKAPEKRRHDKKNKLISAAKLLVYKKGFQDTTLADIAQQADVPLGNVYYYFKTKESLGLAVIEQRMAEWELWKSNITLPPKSYARLNLFVDHFLSEKEQVHSGCPIGYICQELSREKGALGDATKKFMENFLNWVKEHFDDTHLKKESEHLAYTFFSLAQGALTLSHALSNDKILEKQKYTIKHWLSELSAKKVTTNVVEISTVQ